MAWRPVLALLLTAPYLGEVLSTATSSIELLLPWNLALFVALYGSGALLCREMAHRWGLGLPGLALLGAAYGVYEEALVDRFWFNPGYAHDTGVGDYAQVWHTNLLLATRRPRPRLLGLVAFACTSAHFVLVYAVPSTGLPWPAGLAAALTPLVAGVLAVRLGNDGVARTRRALGGHRDPRFLPCPRRARRTRRPLRPHLRRRAHGSGPGLAAPPRPRSRRTHGTALKR